MKKGHSEIVFLLDMTGSMANLVKDTVGGFNTFISEQKKQPGTAELTLAVFNSDIYKKLIDRSDIQSVKEITQSDYIPNGMTPLLDAVGNTIDSVGERLFMTQDSERPENVIFVIMTDGEENYSKKFSFQQIAEKVKHQQDAYNWKFIFMGANIDSFASASSIGIKYDPSFNNVANFVADSRGVGSSYSTISCSTSSYRKTSS